MPVGERVLVGALDVHGLDQPQAGGGEQEGCPAIRAGARRDRRLRPGLRARDHLDTRYRLLGRIVADRVIDRSESSIDLTEPGVTAALEEIRGARAALAALEKKLAESKAAGDPH